MHDWAAVLAAWLLVHGWEALAVVLGIAYLLLAMRESLWCWYAAFFSTLIYLFLMWSVGLIMETALQAYYLGMAVYGWWCWRSGDARNAAPLRITTWRWRQHALAVAAVVLLSGINGLLLSQFVIAKRPYIDAFITWSSVLTTWMVARKVLENWIYWLVIDSLSLALYLDRGLYLTALLFAVYLVIVVFGFFQWWRHYRDQQAGVPTQSTG